MKPRLFSPLQLRQLELKNRILVSPMCQYSAEDGVPNHWHLVHLGSRAVGGAALVMAEATAISAAGRISPGDTGLWNSTHVEAFRPITQFVRDQGSIAAVQLAHAGRKASTRAPWRKGSRALKADEGAWETMAPSALAFDDLPPPREMTLEDIEKTIEDFVQSTRHALEAGFQVVEIHMAHGYLLHEFLSPLSNIRDDSYGGSFDNRIRLPLQVAKAVREIWPEEWPIFVRISATDWVKGGWDLSQSIEFAKRLRDLGVDLIDCSSGGLVPDAPIPVAPHYQVPFADAIRKDAGIPTGAVGLITDAVQAEGILRDDRADVILLARELLRDPYWPLRAAQSLGAEIRWPKQYERAKITEKAK